MLFVTLILCSRTSPKFSSIVIPLNNFEMRNLMARKLFSTLKKRTVSLIPGDGIGPEISNSVKVVFEAAQVLS